MKQVYRRLLDEVKSLMPRKRRVSDEHVSSGGESSGAEENEREFIDERLKVRDARGLPQ
jgi:hypothetical protein